jgi:ribosomal protein S18 acetylase RimI-like enzyme
LTEADLDDLAALLVDAVDSNASVGFPAGLSFGDARSWWQERLADPHATVLVERDGDGRVVGTVQLVRTATPNGRHRAEVAKLMVHRRARRQGAGERLMRQVEAEAVRLGLTLLFLDTETDSDGDRLYRRLGWEVAGVIPGFAYRPDGVLRPTTFLFRTLAPADGPEGGSSVRA